MSGEKQGHRGRREIKAIREDRRDHRDLPGSRGHRVNPAPEVKPGKKVSVVKPDRQVHAESQGRKVNRG